MSFLAKVTAKQKAPHISDGSAFSRLSLDVLLLILSHLPPAALLQTVMLLSSHWRALGASAELWKPLSIARWPSLAAFEREEMANANGAARAGADEFADERSNSSAGATP